MVNYADGKIYRIVCNITGLTYYGSTTQPLTKRLSSHKIALKYSSKIIIENGNYDMVLVELFACKTKEELHARERYFIENNECVNIVIPLQTRKEWREANIDKYKEYQKEYMKEYNKEYREKNKIEINEQRKIWREQNREKLKEAREKNKDKTKEYNKKYWKQHKL